MVLRRVIKYEQLEWMYDQLNENIIYGQEIAKTCSWTYDIQKDQYFYTREIHNILDCKCERFDGSFETYLSYVHPDHKKDLLKVHRHIKEGKEFEIEYRIITKEGRVKYVKEKATSVYSETKKSTKLVGIIQDITSTRLAEEKLEEIWEHLYHAQRISGVGSFKYDPKKDEVIGLPEAMRIHDELSIKSDLKSYIKLVHPQDQLKLREAISNCLLGKSYSIKFRIPQNDGTNKYIVAKADPIYDTEETIVGIVGSIQDITKHELLKKKFEKEHKNLIIAKQKAQEATNRLEHLANHDQLTGLPNSLKFQKELYEQCKEAKEKNTKFALMMLDIDGVEYINYSLGYDYGYKLLKKVVKKLKSYLGEDVFLSRYSGGHFAIIIKENSTRERFDTIAKGIISIFKSSLRIEDFDLNISGNVGICIFNRKMDVDTFRKDAKLALIRAKRAGKNTYEYYNADLDIQNYREVSLRSDLNHVIENNQLRIHYQPIVDIGTNKILAAEALIRWEHPEWGLVYPTDFIKIAEETGCIIDLSAWMLRQIISNYKKWKESKLADIKVSINFSAVELMQINFLENIKSIFQEYQVDPSLLIVEITETVLLENLEKVISNLDGLKAMGIQIALDDFGTGYSSLSYLTSFDIDILKIDGGFMKDISNGAKKTIVETIIELADKLNIKLVAEGIEELEQLTVLQEAKCYAGQGYIYSKPLPTIEFEKILKDGKCEAKVLGKYIGLRERRKLFRVEFNHLLETYLTIKEIEGRRVNIGNTKILVKNMGPGGLCFISNIRLPLNKDFVLQFETEMLEQSIRVNGNLAWTEEMGNDLHIYGVSFLIDEDERSNLVKILNLVQIKMKNDILFAEGNFTETPPVVYFENN